MSSPGQIRRAAERRMRMAVLILAVVVVFLALVVTGLLLGGHRNGGSAGAPSKRTGNPAPAHTPGAGPVIVLPAAAQMAQGIFPVNFPHTPAGAAAFAAATVVNGWTINYTQAANATTVYVDASQASQMQAGVKASVAWFRQQIGIPTTGDIPDGAYLQVQVKGVQILPTDTDHVRVNLLVEYSGGASDAATPIDKIATIGGSVVWENVRGGDWMTIDAPKGTPPPIAPVGSAQFFSDGWSEVTP